MTRRKTAAATSTPQAQPEPANDAATDEVAIAPSTPPNGRVVGGTALPEPGFEDQEEAFPDEEQAEPESAHLSNTERLARQRAAFPEGLPAAPLPTPAPPRARPPAHRRITAELVKAETQLVRLERRRQDSADLHERTWRQKRLALIRSFPSDVLAALHAMNVLDGVEIQESED
jgi:hypothetical protein